MLFEICKDRGPSTKANPTDKSPEDIENYMEQLAISKAREDHANKTLIKSQVKWTNFCREILDTCKSLIDKYDASQKNPAIIEETMEKLINYEKMLPSDDDYPEDNEIKYIPEEIEQGEYLFNRNLYRSLGN